jgi:peptidoglycan/LPS O-acetylase OafA/YrhL
LTVLTAASKNLSALTSIRFLAALRVALFHLVNWDHRSYWWRGLMSTPASVSYFFVSSGFLLTYAYGARFDRDEMNYGKFWLGRSLRLLPVYFLGLLLALPVLLHTHLVALGKMVLTIVLLQSWFPSSALYWNAPAWALSNLAFCYLSLPFLLRATRNFSKTACLIFAAAAWATSLTLSLTYLHLSPDGLTHIDSNSVAFWLYVLKYNPLSHIPEFFIGVLTARLFATTGGFTHKQANFAFVFSTTVILIILLLGYSLPYPVTHTGMLAPLLAVLIASIASGAFIDKILKPKWFVLLGQSSFALYMLHAPLLIFVAWYFANRAELGHIGRLAVVAGIVVLCLALYKWVEAPLTAKLRKSLLHSAAATPKYSE